MKTGRTLVVGIVLVASISVLLCIALLLSEGSCSPGTFSCTNSSLCIPQRSICNSHIDCPNGDDESGRTCSDFHGSSYILEKLRHGLRNLSQEYKSCNLGKLPEGCQCKNKTYAYCKMLGLTEIPTGITGSVSRLVLANNSIKILHEKSFHPYRLNLIHLEGNGIENLPPAIFQNQTHLSKLLLMNNRLHGLNPDIFEGLASLEMLYMQNNQLADEDLLALEKATHVKYLDLTNNRITLDGTNFPEMRFLKVLELDENRITEIRNDSFRFLPRLQSLSLVRNEISVIYRDAFWYLFDLRELHLLHNSLKTLPEEVFSISFHLKKLFLGHNPLEFVPKHLFSNLYNLSSLNLEAIEIENIDVDMFRRMNKLENIYFKKFYYCTFAPEVQKCYPKTDGVSTYEDLLGRPILRVVVWIVAIITFLGNSYVFWGRLTSRDENKVLSWIVRNLAVSDFVMGIYLLVIGYKDIEYRGNYHRMSHEWISSWTCTVIGSIAMLSSEVSIFILVFMSFERFLLIAVPFGGYKNLTLEMSCYSLGIIWACGVSIAAIPVFYWRNSTRFYGANAMCFPLHMDDPYFAGWQFSAFVFIGINLSGIMAIAFLYSGMFLSIWKTRHATTVNFGDFEFAFRFFFIVLTNTACWAPVIVLKFLAFFRIYISPIAYSWVAVLIIPVNSACNPLLYTLTTPKYRELIKFAFTRRLQPFSILRQQISTVDTTYSHASGNKNAVGCCTVSVQFGSHSKANSFDMPTFNTSVERSSSVGCDDICGVSHCTGTGSRGNSFDMPMSILDNTSECHVQKDVKFQETVEATP